MTSRKQMTLLLTVVLFAATTGCRGAGGFLVRQDLPTIAHVHVGHALTGWKDAPQKKGLFVVAREEARTARTQARLAIAETNDLETVRRNVGHVVQAIDPSHYDAAHFGKGPAHNYGLNKALSMAVSHIVFAADSDDASTNVKDFAASFENNAQAVLERNKLILALSQDVFEAASVEDARAMALEIEALTRANVDGVDSDGDGVVGSREDEFGTEPLHRSVQAMLQREDPPYQPVAERYLFGLIRLPSGKWDFAFRHRHEKKGYDGY